MNEIEQPARDENTAPVQVNSHPMVKVLSDAIHSMKRRMTLAYLTAMVAPAGSMLPFPSIPQLVAMGAHLKTHKPHRLTPAAYAKKKRKAQIAAASRRRNRLS